MEWKALILTISWLGASLAGCMPLSCQQSFASGDVNSGEKLLYTSSGTSFNAWCWYSAVTDEGLLYLSKDAITDVSLDFNQLNIDTNRVALTFFKQVEESNMWQIYRGDLRKMDGTGATVLQSISTGFTTPTNAAYQPQYLFLGILNYAEAHVYSTQGFQINNVTCYFGNCDANANSYFAFFTEVLSVNGIIPGFLSNCLTYILPLSATMEVPSHYRFHYEAHFGGCGAFVTSNNLNGYEAGNVGLWFSYDSCGEPGEVQGSTRKVSDSAFGFGSTVTYVCDGLHESGDLVRTCHRETGWSGQNPTCGNGQNTPMEALRIWPPLPEFADCTDKLPCWVKYPFRFKFRHLIGRCTGDQYVTWYKTENTTYFIGAFLCTRSRYSLFMSTSLEDKFLVISDSVGQGEDHCELTGIDRESLPYVKVTLGHTSSSRDTIYSRANWGEAFHKATINLTQVPRWYECGISIPSSQKLYSVTYCTAGADRQAAAASVSGVITAIIALHIVGWIS